MTERTAWAMPAVEVYRPVDIDDPRWDPLWLESLAWSADKQQLGEDIRWYAPEELRMTLLNGFELSRVALSNGITFNESTADALDDAIYQALPVSADDAVPLPAGRFVQRPRFPETRPSIQCLAIAGVPPVILGERKMVHETITKKLGVVEHGDYWAPVEACEVRLAEGSSRSIAALRNFVAQRALLFMPSSLKLAPTVVEGV